MKDYSDQITISMYINYVLNVLKYIGIDKANKYENYNECIKDFSKDLEINNDAFKKILYMNINKSEELKNYQNAVYTIESIKKKNINLCDWWINDITNNNEIFKKFKEKAQKEISELKKSSTQMNINQEIEKLENENNEFEAKEKPNIEEKKEDKKESINDEVITKNKESDEVEENEVKNKEKEEPKEEITENELDRQLEILANTNKDKFNELVDDVNKTDETVRAVKLLNDDITFNWFKNTLPNTCEKFKKAIENNKDLLNKLNTFVKELDEKKVVNNDKEMSNEKENIDQSKNDKSPEEVQEEPLNQSEEENNSSDDENIDAYNINNEEDSDENDEIIFDDIDDNLVEEELPSLDELGSTIDNNKSSIISENDDKKIEEIYNLIKENKFIKIDDETMKRNNPKIISDLIDYFNDNRKEPKWFIYLDSKLKESIDDFYLDDKDIDKFRNPNTRSSEGREIIKNILTTIKTQLLHNEKLNYKIIKNIYNKIKNIKNEKDEELQKIGLDDFSDRSKNEIKKIISSNSIDIDSLINQTYMNELNSGRILNFIESSSLPYLPPVSYFLESMPKY